MLRSSNPSQMQCSNGLNLPSSCRIHTRQPAFMQRTPLRRPSNLRNNIRHAQHDRSPIHTHAYSGSQQFLQLEHPQQNLQSNSCCISRRHVHTLVTGLALALCSSARAAPSCDLVTAKSGLQYCDLKEGTGFVPIAGAFVKGHYVAKLAGTSMVFDSSYKRGRPLLFKAGEKDVIAGWDEAILGSEDVPPMREGGKRRVVLPPGSLQRQGPKSLVWVVGLSEALEMAGIEYGEAGGSLAPNVGLEFELELLLTKKSN